MSTSVDTVDNILKSAPPVTVSAVSLAGMSLQEWVYILTIIWLVLQITSWVWNKFKKE